MKSDKNDNARLLGLGFDNTDGHVRVTKGDNFQLYGGSDETHERMQDSCIKFNEKLRQRGKNLQQLEKNELMDLAGECDMNMIVPPSPENGSESQ